MTKKRSILPLLLLASALSATAQTNHITLRGHITDYKTREALPAVTVYVAGQAIYTQTNNDGDYVLKVPAEYANGHIVFSLMGYLCDTVAMTSVEKHGDRQLRSDGGHWLKEVSVVEYSPTSARQLLIEAVNRIPQNNQTDSTIGTWFYRDVRELNGELFVFDEMVFDALRVGYDKHHTLKKLQNRAGPSNAVILDYKRPIESNYTAIRHDRLLLYDTDYVERATNGAANSFMGYKESEVLYDPLEVPNTTNYLSIKKLKRRKDLQMREMTDADGKEYYVVYRNYDDSSNMMIVSNALRVTIAKQTLAIVKVEHESYLRWVNVPFPLKGMLKKAGIKTFGYGERTVHTYGQVNGRNTLTSSTRNEVYEIHCLPGSPMGDSTLYLNKHSQCVLTAETKKGTSTFLSCNTIQGPGSVLINQRRADDKNYNEAFWQQYNFIPLEKSIQQKLTQRLNAQ